MRKSNYNIQLNVGFNDKDTKAQIIPTEQAERIILDIINATIGDCTIVPSTGTYTHESGERVIERGVQVTACTFGTTKANAKAMTEIAAKKICKALNQESVVLKVSKLDTELFMA